MVRTVHNMKSLGGLSWSVTVLDGQWQIISAVFPARYRLKVSCKATWMNLGALHVALSVSQHCSDWNCFWQLRSFVLFINVWLRVQNNTARGLRAAFWPSAFQQTGENAPSVLLPKTLNRHLLQPWDKINMFWWI